MSSSVYRGSVKVVLLPRGVVACVRVYTVRSVCHKVVWTGRKCRKYLQHSDNPKSKTLSSQSDAMHLDIIEEIERMKKNKSE